MSPTSSSRAPFRSLAKAAFVGFALGVLGVLALPCGTSSRVLARFGQPSSVNYKSYDPYTLFIVELEEGFLFRHVSHELRIMRGDDLDGYGYVLEVHLAFLEGDPPAILGQPDGTAAGSKVTWTPDGIAIDFPSRHRFFIPKKAFTGGR